MPLGAKVDLGPGHFALHGNPASPPLNTGPMFIRPMSIVVKMSPVSATAEHL